MQSLKHLFEMDVLVTLLMEIIAFKYSIHIVRANTSLDV